MASSKIFSGSGNPNGVVTGVAGDIFQDRATAAVWIRTASPPPNVWQQILVEPVPAGPILGFADFSAGLEVDWAPAGPTTIPYSSPSAFQFGANNGNNFGWGVKAAQSSDEGALAWVVARAGTLLSLRVNVRNIGRVGVVGQPAPFPMKFVIKRSAACNQPFIDTVLSISGVTTAGCYDVAGVVPIALGDQIAFRAGTGTDV